MAKLYNFVITLLWLIVGQCYAGSGDLQQYKMCVPHHIYENCVELMKKPSTIANIQCVSARDRMECLEKVNRREADFLTVDPEDMYVAFHMKNEDFSLFSEIRTVEESQAEFRYEGIILVKKNSNIHSLSDLKNKKSCHTGYGRNVGYKIPITKLKAAGILKISNDPHLTFVEKELKGLTEMFTQSCLVGKWSPNAEINAALKKRYSNLCALCEHPDKCDYPDNFSGYDGAIRCLVQNGGEVAFTKVIYVRRFFGLPIGNNPAKTTAAANPNDYEYLCEDGSRKPVTGPACSWAQRPWQGYMGNADVNTKLTKLQDRLNAFFTDAKLNPNKNFTAKMWVNDNLTVVKKEKQTLPGEHLTKAKYKDVIERDGNTQSVIKLCVKSEVDARKCDVLSRVAFSRDIRPKFECVVKPDCIKAVHDKQADAVVLPGSEFKKGRTNNLKPLLYEQLDENVFYVATIGKDVKNDVAKKAAINFDATNPRSLDAALYFNFRRNIQQCPNAIRSVSDAPITITSTEHLNTNDNSKELLCPDNTRKSLTEVKTCNLNGNLLGGAVFVRNGISEAELVAITHGFTSLNDKFRHGSKTEDVFELFGEFEPGAHNVIFNDDTGSLVSQVPTQDEDLYNRLRCVV